MCGIVGIWQKNKQPVSPELLTRMRDIMHNRGPDDCGIWLDRTIGFGHRRLSILDLSSLGHQPMIDELTGAVIVHNGEVYNFQEIREELKACGIIFKSQTDTEVILKAYRKWGVSCVDKFVGMFSFAIWDAKVRAIFIARDRMGIKPLYYYCDAKIFMFASRLSVLMQHPLCPDDIDNESLGLYLEMGFIPAPWSMIKGVKKLKPGHVLWVDEKGLTETCYWSMDTISIDASLDKLPENELVERFDTLLHKAIKPRLISDVPLGAFLSGGIDSSLVTAIMCQFSQKPPETFTIGFDEKQYDESDYAQKIAKHLGANNNLKIMKSTDLLSLLNDNTLFYDEPIADASSLPTMMVSRFAKQYVTVCLSGDGGDELFWGYHQYLILSYSKYLYRLPYALRFMLGKLLTKTNNHKLTLVGQSFFQKNLFNSFAFMRKIERGYERNSLFAEGELTMEDLFRERASHFPILDVVSKSSRLDATYYLPDDILQKVDIASMSSSLEVRVPILDHRIVEFAQSLPVKYKLRGIGSKYILKKVLSKYIPRKLFERPKRGFVAPIDKWFRGELKEMIQDELSPSQIKQFGYLKPDGVKKLLDTHLSNRNDTHLILWALLVLLRWNKQFRK